MRKLPEKILFRFPLALSSSSTSSRTDSGTQTCCCGQMDKWILFARWRIETPFSLRSLVRQGPPSHAYYLHRTLAGMTKAMLPKYTPQGPTTTTEDHLVDLSETQACQNNLRRGNH